MTIGREISSRNTADRTRCSVVHIRHFQHVSLSSTTVIPCGVFFIYPVQVLAEAIVPDKHMCQPVGQSTSPINIILIVSHSAISGLFSCCWQLSQTQRRAFSHIFAIAIVKISLLSDYLQSLMWINSGSIVIPLKKI